MTDHPIIKPTGQPFHGSIRRALGHGVEVQPSGAGATTPEPTRMDGAFALPLPYCYRINRPAPHRPEGEFMMSWGHWEVAPDSSIKTVHHAATYAALCARTEHSYTGPMTVMVWADRGPEEHYRAVPPGTAYVLQLGQETCPHDPEYLHQGMSRCPLCSRHEEVPGTNGTGDPIG